MSMLRRSFCMALLVMGGVLHAQSDSLVWVEYHGGFDLRDGVYFDFKAFRMNTPSVPIARLRDQGVPVQDIRRVVSKLTWQPDTGAQRTIRKENLWGFSQNGVAYISAGNGFYRIGLMGSLSHMVFEMNYRDWDPYMYPYGGVTRTVLVQQLLDMESGEFLRFNAASMDHVLQKDPVLLEEFRALPKKQRNSDEAVFRFMRLYNERHPLRFPQ